MASPVSSEVTSSRAPSSWSRALGSRRTLLALISVAVASALICFLSFTRNPQWRPWLFQSIAILFFCITVLRSASRPAVCKEAEPQSPAQQSTGLVGLCVALAAGAASYATTVPLYFICDDFDHLSLIRQPFMKSIWPQITEGQFDGLAHIFYRPLGYASLFVDYRLWHNWSPGYHLTAIAIHLVCIAGIFFFCRQLGLRSESCFAASLLFAVLPVNVQTVTWVTCRFDLLATTFGIWSLTFAARFRRTGRIRPYCAALALFVLAALTKESAYVIPVLWFALELIPQAWQPLQSPFTRRSEPLLGYILGPLLMFVHRYLTLGGVGGYRVASDGNPLVQRFGMQSLIGVGIRAPGETLFGYDWLQPGGRFFLLATGVTAAIFLTLCRLAKLDSLSRRVTWFCMIWVLVAALPAHFYFFSPDTGLFFSRVLHFGSVGIAILLGVLLGQTFTHPKTCIAWTLVTSALLLVGLQHNVAAWQHASHESRRAQATLERVQPSPAPHAVLYLKGIPKTINGVPFFTIGLESAVRFHYAWRDDIRVRTLDSQHIESTAIPIDMDFRPAN